MAGPATAQGVCGTLIPKSLNPGGISYEEHAPAPWWIRDGPKVAIGENLRNSGFLSEFRRKVSSGLPCDRQALTCWIQAKRLDFWALGFAAACSLTLLKSQLSYCPEHSPKGFVRPSR